VAVALLAVIAAPLGSNLQVLVNLVFFLWLAVVSGTLLWRAPSALPALSNVPSGA
jgi:hypothetical protein